MYKITFIVIIILLSSKINGQVILSQTNEQYETHVNDIIKQNIGKQLEFSFYNLISGKNEKTEVIKIVWEKPEIINVSQASTDNGATIDKLRTTKYEYVNGYFSDLVKNNGNYIEVTKTAEKNLVLKGYRDGKLAVENKILLNENKETIFSDHSNYYSGSPKNPVRTITSYLKTIVNNSTTITTQQSYDITTGSKKLKHKFVITETSSFDKKTSIRTIICKTKSTLSIGPQTDSEYKTLLTLNSIGKIIKIESQDKRIMTVTYK